MQQKRSQVAFDDVNFKAVEYYSMNSGKLGKFSECVRFVTIGVLAEVSEQQIYLGFPIPDNTYHKLWLAIAVCDHQPPQTDTRHQRQNLKTPQTRKSSTMSGWNDGGRGDSGTRRMFDLREELDVELAFKPGTKRQLQIEREEGDGILPLEGDILRSERHRTVF